MERFSLAEATAHVGSWEWEFSTDRFWSSPELRRIYGFPPDKEARLLDLYRRLHPADLEYIDRITNQTIRERGYTTYSYRVVRSDGSVRHCASVMRAVVDRSGQTVGLYGVTRDITDLRRAEAEQARFQEELRRSEDQLRRIVETAQEGIWMLDTDGNTVFANPVLAEILTCDRERLIGTPIFHFLDPETLKSLRAQLKENAMELPRQEVTLQRCDGTSVWVEATAKSLYGADGGFRGMLGTIIDITERKKAEATRELLLHRVSAESTWLRAVIRASTAAIVLVTVSEPDVLLVNPAASKLLGFPENIDRINVDELTDVAISSGGTRLNVGEMRDAVFRGLQLNAVEMTIHRPDADVEVIVSGARVHDEAGMLLGAVSVVDDVSEIKRLQRLREEWTSIVAHDLRQPLTTILTNIELSQVRLRAQGKPPEKALERAAVAAHQIDRLIGDLTDASLVDTKRLRLEKRPIHTGSFLQEVAGRSGIGSLVAEIDDTLPDMLVDPDRIEQVLQNLLGNAKKYGMPDRPIYLRARSHNGGVEIQVENEGNGIPAKDLPHIFDRYERAGRPRGVAGLGLGLYIAKGITDAHGGQITAKSVPGETTVFTVALPAGA